MLGEDDFEIDMDNIFKEFTDNIYKLNGNVS